MTKITSADLGNAIDFVKSQPDVSDELARRDRDDRLDCTEIRCRVISKVDAPAKVFEIIFDYADIKGKVLKREDIGARVEYRDGSPRLLDWAAY